MYPQKNPQKTHPRRTTPPFLHDGGALVLDNGHRLGAVDVVGLDGVAVQVPNRLDGPGLAVELNLVGLLSSPVAML